MLLMLLLLAIAIFLIWIGATLQHVLADFLSYFLLAYLTKFGYSQVSWIDEFSQVVSVLVIVWLALVLWKDFGKERFHTMLKTLHH